MRGKPKKTPAHGGAKREVRLFISYSHKDKKWMDWLKPLLDGFQYDKRLVNIAALESELKRLGVQGKHSTAARPSPSSSPTRSGFSTSTESCFGP